MTQWTESTPKNPDSEFKRFKILFASFRQKNPKAKRKEFLDILDEIDFDDFNNLASDRLLRDLDIPKVIKPKPIGPIIKDLLDKIPVYIDLYAQSHIQGKRWGDLTGAEWGTLGAKYMSIRRLLGKDKTAWDIFDKNKPKETNKKFNEHMSGMI
jgi:hypothetical protein